MQTKRCSTCKETKSVSEFSKNRSANDGLAFKCKMCVKEYRRKHYEANKEKILESQRRYREANKEKLAKYHRKYRESNKEKIAESRRKYYQANKEKVNESIRKCHEANREQERRRKAKSAVEANNRSLELAHRKGLPWEDWEVEFVLANNGLTNYQKAVRLGRSYYTVRFMKSYLRKKARNELTPDTVRV